MQLKAIFFEFIPVVRKNSNYLIGLLDTNHRVIVASDSNVVGEVISMDMETTKNRYFELKIGNQLEGYLWVHVHDEDETIGMVGSLFYTSLKARIERQYEKERTLESLTLEDQLIHELVMQRTPKLSRVRDLMRCLKLSSNVPRVAIYLLNNDGFSSDEVTNLGYKIGDSESFYSLINEQTLLIFKAVHTSKISDAYKYLDRFTADLREWGLTNCYCAVGTIQCQVRLYASSYDSCKWIIRQVDMRKDQAYFFTDHLFSFFCENLSHDALVKIFDYYFEKSVNLDCEEMVAVSNALMENNFNLKQAADTLFLHKNTLLYKLKSYERILNIDIRGSMNGKILFFVFCDLMKKRL